MCCLTESGHPVFEHWLSSADSHLATPDASPATNPVENFETFDPPCPSPSPDKPILLPIGKVASYLDVALKTLTPHTEARTPFIPYTTSFFRSSHPINLTEQKHFFFTFHCALLFPSSNTFPFKSPPSPPTKRMSTLSNILRGWTICARMATRILSAESTQARIRPIITSPCDSSHKHRTKGSADACLACARHRHSRLHTLPWGPLRQCGRLGVGGSSGDCGGWRDVLDKGRWCRCGSHVRSYVVTRVGVRRDRS